MRPLAVCVGITKKGDGGPVAGRPVARAGTCKPEEGRDANRTGRQCMSSCRSRFLSAPEERMGSGSGGRDHRLRGQLITLKAFLCYPSSMAMQRSVIRSREPFTINASWKSPLHSAGIKKRSDSFSPACRSSRPRR